MSHKELFSTSINLLKKHEGLKLKVYKCPAGKLTIGFGRNLEDNGITESEAEFLLFGDIGRIISELKKRLNIFDELSVNRQAVLVDMAFNLGITGLFSFKKMIAAIESQDFKNAAKEMQDSRWFNQVGNRAKFLQKLIMEG